MIDSDAIISMYRHHHDQLRRCRDNADMSGITLWQQRIEDLEVISTYYGWSVRPSTDGHTHIRPKAHQIEVALWD